MYDSIHNMLTHTLTHTHTHTQAIHTLSLYGVEVREPVLVEGLKGRVPKGRDREGLQIQQLCGWGELLRQDEVPEGDWKDGLRGNPGVRHNTDEILRGQRLKDRNKEGDQMLVLSISLL